MDLSELPEVAKAVNRWLSYQILCGREGLLSESYLGHPVAEYLVHHHSGQLEAKVDHPILNRPRPGRPRQIDYVLRTRDAKVIEAAIECKWISTTPYDKQRIVNDILRLECVRVEAQHVKRFFLVAGKKEDFKRNFQDVDVNNKGKHRAFTRSILSFSKTHSTKPVDVLNCPSRFQDFYRAFADSFVVELP